MDWLVIKHAHISARRSPRSGQRWLGVVQRVREGVVKGMRTDWLTPTSARAALMLWRSRRTFRVLDCRKPIAGHNLQVRTPDKPHEIFSGHIRIGSRAYGQQSHRSPRL